MTEDKIMDLRIRRCSFVLWCDDPRFVDQMESVVKENTAFIQHDKDIDEKGKTKKAHVHVILVLKNARTIKSICKEFKLEDENGKLNSARINIINNKKNKTLKGAYLYLVHANAKDKYQYDVNEIGGDLAEDAKRVINASLINDEDCLILMMKDWIDNEKFISMKRFMEYAIDNGYGKKAMNRWYFWGHYIEEHNRYYKEQK